MAPRLMLGSGDGSGDASGSALAGRAAAAGAVAFLALAAVASLAAPGISGAAPYSRLLVVLLIGGAGCGILVAGLRFETATAHTWAVAMVAAAWLVAIAGGDGTWSRGTPLVAGGLLAVSELSHWSFDLRAGGVDEPGVRASRGEAIALLCIGAAAVAVTPGLAASVPPIGGEDVAALAALAVVAAASAAGGMAWWRRRAARQ